MRDYRVLIVDDDAVDRRLYCKFLNREGADTCTIQQAATGRIGLAALHSGSFDCVLLDFNLPDLSGVEFLIAAAQDGELPCGIVLVTGHGTEAIAVDAMKHGAHDYLVKDHVNANSLWRALTQAVTQAELKRRLTESLRHLTASNMALGQEVAIRTATEIELRAAKESAEEASKAKTRFVAMVTHELRTPLNGILGYAQLLRLEGGLAARQDAHVGAMIQAGHHLLGMIERVLDFASIENGRMELHPIGLSVADLTEECISLISPMAVQRGLELRVVNSHAAPRRIVADPARLRQVIINLLGNAVKYTDAGSIEMRLLAGSATGGLRVEIADTGKGIDEVSRRRLFQDFERIDNATSVEGTGLGLAIAARIVRLMGGTIDHAPNPTAANPDGGSIFWFECPTAQDPPELPTYQPAPATPAGPGQRVLLVDDIKINRDIIGAFLEAGGHSFVETDSGPEALLLAATQHFDMILMDVRMPGMDGIEATRRIRVLPAPFGQVPIIALTAYTFLNQVAQCREAGMDGHVPKPVDYQTLMSAIDDAITRTRSRIGDGHGDEHAPVPVDELPPSRLDRAVLNETLAFLPPATIADTLLSLRSRKEQMLQLLDRSAGLTQQVEAAHALASAAGMFGFAALSTASRRFEIAAAQDLADVDDLAQQLRVEALASMVALDAVMHEEQALRP